ncbi:MAG: hypothetical protein DMF08_12970 [Verrucomicrobia bacterium]|nr:MAG: hypothetical protein DMF08_12970 [Verrucomicrobiota bacterium]
MDADYKVKLEVFEGPLDLLLYLIKQEEIDIYDISLERITSQYLEYLQSFKELNIELAGEFIVMAANLIYVKSRSLLPPDQQPPEEDAAEDDPQKIQGGRRRAKSTCAGTREDLHPRSRIVAGSAGTLAPGRSRHFPANQRVPNRNQTNGSAPGHAGNLQRTF